VNYARAAVAALVATLVYYMIGFFAEGWLFRGDFAAYSQVYRPADTVMRYMPLGIVCSFIGAFVVAVIFARLRSERNRLLEGARLGALIGLFVACVFDGTNYVILNIGGELAFKLAAAELVQWIVVGLVIALIYRPRTAAP
jgi:H+/Cl- antiporter ClcA